MRHEETVKRFFVPFVLIAMQTTKGDLLKLALDGRFDVIVHGCNCMCQMGAGNARSIKKQFPEAFEADQRTIGGDRGKLGTITTADITRARASFTIVNAYTQYDYRPPGPNVNYDAIRAALREIKRRFAGKRIGYPKIGAGLAGGDWSRIAAIIDEELAGEDHTCIEFESSPAAEHSRG
jgi:O-acetyl-ADP-ribose deacetylase (regulator of RNase III)